MPGKLHVTVAVALCAALVPVGAAAAPPDRAATTPVAAARSGASASSISGAELTKRLNSALNQAGGSSGAWVLNDRSGNVIYARGAGTSRPLASNEKLFVTGTAIDRFGVDGRLDTSLWRTGAVDSEGVLDGDLYLLGGGNPAIANPSLARRHALGIRTRLGALAERAAELGIRRVTGQLYVDDTLFDRVRGTPATGYRISSEFGSLSALTYNYSRTGSGFASNPEFHAGRRMIELLRSHGVSIGADVNHKRLSQVDGEVKISLTRSPRIADLAAATNKPSNNFFAEILLKGIGAAYAGGGTTSQGAAEVESFASSLGASLNAVDGSGLGRSNTAAPREVGEFLTAMRDHAGRVEFQASLPKAAREGTVANRMRGTAAAGRCRTKTGTLSDVSTLSGYCYNASGKTMVFSILMKNVNVSNARIQQDRMVDAIARY